MRFQVGNYLQHFLAQIFNLLFLLIVINFIRAGKPPIGLHLDVLKGDKLIQVKNFE